MRIELPHLWNIDGFTYWHTGYKMRGRNVPPSSDFLQIGTIGQMIALYPEDDDVASLARKGRAWSHGQ